MTHEEILHKHMKAYCDETEGQSDSYMTVEEIREDPVFKVIFNSMEEYANQDKWISVKDELPEVEKVGNKVLLYREMNDSQKEMSFTVYDTFLVKHCDETTFWMPLPNPPKNL